MAPTTKDLTPRVVYGPSGVGKGTIIGDAKASFPDLIDHCVSHTSRQPRQGEVPGTAYHFVTREEFEKLKAEDGFIETAQYGGNYYGTSVAAVNAVQDAGKIAVLDIEIEGVKQVRSHASFKAKFLYLAPPSREVLEERLRGRKTDSEEQILKRLKQGVVEMAYGENEGKDDTKLVNDDLETAKKEFKEWLGLRKE